MPKIGKDFEKYCKNLKNNEPYLFLGKADNF